MVSNLEDQPPNEKNLQVGLNLENYEVGSRHSTVPKVRYLELGYIECQ